MKLLLLFFASALFGEARVLVGSPVRQSPNILREFLESLDSLEKRTYTLDYYFVDDNDVEESRELLEAFAIHKGSKCTLFTPQHRQDDPAYHRNEMTHFWREDLIWKVAGFKDRIIEFARGNEYDYLFLIDSDLLLHPRTIDQLIDAGKEIVSNIFWTSWYPNTPPLPQVWLKDIYTQYEVEIGEQLSDQEISKRHFEFIEKLKYPGVYEVGGLGACTLISKKALEQPINFKKIKNISFWGEDRHFCIRAAALGIALHVDTHFPAYHIYRESYLSGVEEYKKITRL